MRKLHAAEHIGRLGELDIIVADNLDAVAPGIAEIEKASGQRRDACLRQRLANRLLVVDDETEMAAVIGSLAAALLKRQELVAKVDESRILAPAAQLEIEQAAIEGQRLVDIANFEGDVIEPDCASLLGLRHELLPCATAGNV